MVSVEIGLIVVAFVALLCEVVAFVANKYFLNPPESREEKRLEAQVRRLKAEAKSLEGYPSTFMEFAKVGREAAQGEKRIEELRIERESRKNTKAGKYAAQAAYILFPISMAFAYYFWLYMVSELEPVAHVPNAAWVWPMASILALPNQPANGSISSVGWMFLCRRVFARLLDLIIVF